MAANAKGGARRKKDQEQAAFLKAKGEYHGFRHAPWNHGINFPHLADVGSAAYRRARYNN